MRELAAAVIILIALTALGFTFADDALDLLARFIHWAAAQLRDWADAPTLPTTEGRTTA